MRDASIAPSMPSKLATTTLALALFAITGHASAETSLPTAVTAPAFDKGLPRPFFVDMIGANDNHALLRMKPRNGELTYGVLDLSTSCIVETRPTFARVEKLKRLQYPRQNEAAQALADPAVQVELRRYIAFHRRFGLQRDGEFVTSSDFAWSSDGSKVIALGAEAIFRSRDGGQSFEQLDTNMSRVPFVTRDGRWAYYQRCGDPKLHSGACLQNQEIGIVDLGSAAAPRVVTATQGSIAGLDPTGQKLVVVRDDEPLKLVTTHLDPTNGTFARAFTLAAPPLPKHQYFTLDPSRGGKFGTFHHWVNATQSIVEVVSMTDGRVVFKQQRQFVGHDVDDEGRLAWGTVNLVRSFGTTPKGAIKDAGPGDRIGWAPGGRLLVFDNKKDANTKLGDVACKLVRVVKM